MYADFLVRIKSASEKEAIDNALQSYLPSLCHQCANNIELGEIDHAGDVIAEEIDD